MTGEVTEPTGVNAPLLRKIWEHINAHPEEWHQQDWAIQDGIGVLTGRSYVKQQGICGSAYCVAGWAVVMSGHTLEITEDSDGCTVTKLDGETAWMPSSTISRVATRELGIPVDDAGALFHPYNKLEDIKREIEKHLGEELL